MTSQSTGDTYKHLVVLIKCKIKTSNVKLHDGAFATQLWGFAVIFMKKHVFFSAYHKGSPKLYSFCHIR